MTTSVTGRVTVCWYVTFICTSSWCDFRRVKAKSDSSLTTVKVATGHIWSNWHRAAWPLLLLLLITVLMQFGSYSLICNITLEVFPTRDMEHERPCPRRRNAQLVSLDTGQSRQCVQRPMWSNRVFMHCSQRSHPLGDWHVTDKISGVLFFKGQCFLNISLIIYT